MHAQDYVRQKDRSAISSEHHGPSDFDDSEVPF
jgi:hypothetical protein